MQTTHLSSRALRRAHMRILNSQRHAERRYDEAKKRDSDDSVLNRLAGLTLRQWERGAAVGKELESRPIIAPENHWTLKPGAVIEALKDEKGIGLDFATRVKRHARAVDVASVVYVDAFCYRARVAKRVEAGVEPERMLTEALAAQGKALERLERLEASAPVRPSKRHGVSY